MVHTPVDINQVKRLAATGHFRSIALWLNYPLVPQAIYARVQTDQYPGYLQVLLEFERPPNQDALIRLVCNRLCRLESNIIHGVYLIGRLIGTDQCLWQQRIKLTQRKRAPQQITTASSASAPSASAPADTSSISSPETTITTTPYGSSKTLNAVPSYLVPRESNHQEGRRRPNRSNTPSAVVQIRPATIDSTQTPAQRRSNRRRFAAKEMVEQQFKYMRAIVVTGSAAAAFILGCVTETIMFQRGQLARKQEPTLPIFNDGGWRTLSDVEAQEIAYRSAMQGPTVPAALETVAVMPHAPGSNPENPTVTLLFGGEVAVGDVPLQTPEAVEQVLGELEAFREADVAMVGLGNSLASADTSLQENYFERARPEAVDALTKGGIDIVALTGDRTMDFGRQGLTETLKALDSAGIYRVGAGLDHQEARRPEVLEVKGQRIAYLSYAPSSEEVATLDRAGLNIQERDGIVEDIAALRQAVDWIVVNYRWYGDLETEPNAQQIDLSRSAIDAGADLVVGYHAQQLQGAELYKSRPIVYALGDFIFQDEPLEDNDTATLRVSLRDQQMKVEFLPISVREARPRVASGEMAKTILKQIRQASDALPSPLQFPAILEAAPQDRSLLKPKKTTPPVKSLGELEPGPNSIHWQERDTDAPEFFEPEFFEPNGFESNSPDALGSEVLIDTMPPVPDEPLEVEGYGRRPDPLSPNAPGSEVLIDTMPPMLNEPLEAESHELPGPLDSFQVQPDDELERLQPGDQWEPTIPEVDRNSTIPKALPDSPLEQPIHPDNIIDETDVDSIPEQNDDILMPSEQTLPGYEALEDWGEKSSPHKEFNPIQDRLNSLEPLDLESSDHLLPATNDAARDQAEAISPHDEPLVGPLSQQPTRIDSDKLIS
ncbi:MAG: CapA family protein [Cyanobacteria bacterium P01_F01_bin.13]